MQKIGGLFILTLLLHPALSFPRDVPLKPSGFVNDYAKALTEEETAALESLVAEIEGKTSAEIGVAVIRSLEGKNIESYANDIFNSWGIGKKDKDNGVLLLVSLDDRQTRIEVGYGLEPALPDAVCGRIIRNVMAPRFRENNYYRGLADAVTVIGQHIKGEAPAAASDNNPDKWKLSLFMLVWNGFLALFSFLLLHTAGVIIYLAILIPSVIIVLLSGKEIQPAAATGLLILFPFLLVFLMGMLSPVIFALIRRRLKKKYKEDWKQHVPPSIRKAMSRSGSSGGGRRSGGSFGGGHSGGGGASGRW